MKRKLWAMLLCVCMIFTMSVDVIVASALSERDGEGNGKVLPTTDVENGDTISAEIDGKDIFVTGDLPVGARLSVEEADDTEQLIEFGLSEALFSYDIKVLGTARTEWQPKEGGYVLIEVQVDAEVGTPIGLLHTHDGKTTYMGTTYVNENGTIEVFANGFSTFSGFTVDFHYNNVDHSIEGMTSILLSELFAALGIEEDASLVEAVSFSDPTLVAVSQQNGDWLLTSLEAFGSEELLIITFKDGRVITIDVTDEQELGYDGDHYVFRIFENRSDFYIQYQSDVKNGGGAPIKFVAHDGSGTETGSATGNHYFASTISTALALGTRFVSVNNGLWFHIYDHDAYLSEDSSRHSYQIGNNTVWPFVGTDTVNFRTYSTAVSWTKSSGATIDPNLLCSVQIESRVSTGTESRNLEVYYNGVKAGEAKNILFPNRNQYDDGFDQRNALIVSQKNTGRYQAQTYTLTYEDADDTQNVPYTYDAATKTYKLYFYDYSYRLDYDLNGGAGTFNSLTAGPVASGSYTFTVSGSEPQKDGYTFLGWDDSSTASTAKYAKGGAVTVDGIQSSDGTTKTAAKTIYAVWSANSYNVSFNGNGATGGSMSTQTYAYDKTYTLPANAFVKNYIVSFNANSGSVAPTSATAYGIFNGWSHPGSQTLIGNMASVSNLAKANGSTVTLTANWTLGTVTLPEPMRAGNKFLGWYTESVGGEKVGDAGDSYTPTKNVTLYARWEETTYTVTWKNYDGTVLETDNDVAYGVIPTYDGNEPKRASTAEYSYTFAGWAPAVSAVTGNVTYTAQFTEMVRTYTVTWILEQDDTGEKISTKTLVKYGTAINAPSITIPANYDFYGWGDYPETMPAEDITVKGMLNRQYSSLTIKKSWSGSGSSVPAVFKIKGDDFELTVVIPADKTSVTVGHLPVGENYTVSEVDAVQGANINSSEVAVTISKTSENEVNFMNTWRTDLYWLFGSYSIDNRFGI